MLTDLNFSQTPLNGTCITHVAEDDKGGIYISNFAYSLPKNSEENKASEGLVVLDSSNNWNLLDIENSGMPVNHINNLLYDKYENVLWIACDNAGLVRYDLTNLSWENYTTSNSDLLSNSIYSLSINRKGIIYASTFYGLLELSRPRKVKRWIKRKRKEKKNIK